MDFRARYKFDVNKDLLGKGDCSRVYRANDTLLERVVALKFFTSNASEQYQVLNEIKKLIRFEHPNLCKYYDVEVFTSRNIMGEQERVEVGIMEYLDAGDFKSFVAAHPEFTDKLLVDVLNGLSYLHKRGIVYRGLKPQNMLIKMIDEKPVAKITDFRASKLINGSKENSSALPGPIEYIAPEQFNPKKYGINGKIATNLDLWSFGLIVYETLQAEPLFGSRSAGVSAEQIMANILNDDYLAKVEAAPPKYRTILRRCLVKEAAKRVQNAADLIPLFEGAVQSRPHVFVTPQAAYPKIVDPVHKKAFSDPKPGPGKEPELPVSEDHSLHKPLQDHTTPTVQGLEGLEKTKEFKQPSPAKVDVNRPVITADNRLADEPIRLNPQQDGQTVTTQLIDLNQPRPTSPEKITPVLAEEPTPAVMPVDSAFAENRRPYKSFKPAAGNKEEKPNASWKSIASGLLLVVSFTALILSSPNDIPVSVQSRNKPAAVQVHPSAPMLPQMVDVSGGVFLMGYDGKDATDPEKPVHPVLVSDFSIGKYEVTIGEFRNFIAATGYQTTAEREKSTFIYDNNGNSRQATVNWQYDINGNRIDSAQANLPVVHVSWYDAVAYCNWLSEKTNKKYRLPTEAEWEYTARGGNKSQLFDLTGANSLSVISWNGDNSGNTYHPVGGKKPNELGLFDMIGNVYEWCADWYDEHAYRSGSAENPTGPKSGNKKVIRGGSWYRDGGPEYYRPTIRFLLDPKERGAKVGFRVCISSEK